MTTMTLTVEAEIELLGFSMGQLMTVADKGNIGFQGFICATGTIHTLADDRDFGDKLKMRMVAFFLGRIALVQLMRAEISGAKLQHHQGDKHMSQFADKYSQE